MFTIGQFIFGIGVLLMMVGFFVKSLFVYMAVIGCMLGAFFTGEFDENAWVLAAICCLALWGVLASIKAIREGGY